MVLVIASAAACTDVKGPPLSANKKTIADSADQVAFGQRTLITDRGLNRAEILSDTAFIFDENTRTDMRIVNAVFYDSQGNKNAVMSSRMGQYNERLHSLEARGDVRITAIDGRHLESPFVRYDQRMNQVSSDTTFTMTDPDGRVIKGIGFTTDPDLQNFKVLRLGSAKGGAVAVPK
jgi:LPS export ABC transporter protein LptC